MNGPGHYREAEWLLDLAHHFTYGDGADPVTGAALASEAQGHATLALAAATATAADVAAAAADIRHSCLDGWSRVIAPPPPAPAEEDEEADLIAEAHP